MGSESFAKFSMNCWCLRIFFVIEVSHQKNIHSFIKIIVVLVVVDHLDKQQREKAGSAFDLDQPAT